MMLAHSGKDLESCVRPEMREEFLRDRHKVFATSDPRSKRTPGQFPLNLICIPSATKKHAYRAVESRSERTAYHLHQRKGDQ